MSALEDLQCRVSGFAKSPPTKELVNELFKLLAEQNRFNYRAQIKVCEHPAPKIDLDGIPYQTDSYFHFDDDENGDYQDIYDLQEEIERVTEVVDDRKYARDSFYDNVQHWLIGHLHRWQLLDIGDYPGAYTEDDIPDDEDLLEHICLDFDIEAWVALAESYLEDLERADRGRGAEPQYEEALTGSGFKYPKVDRGVARMVGLGCGKLGEDGMVDDEPGDDFIFLRGCGQDMSYQFIAYETLVYGSISAELVSAFDEPRYLRGEMGDELFKQVTEKLGIAECMETAQAEADEHMRQFDATCERYRKIRDSGDFPPEMNGIIGLMMLAPALRRD